MAVHRHHPVPRRIHLPQHQDQPIRARVYLISQQTAEALPLLEQQQQQVCLWNVVKYFTLIKKLLHCKFFKFRFIPLTYNSFEFQDSVRLLLLIHLVEEEMVLQPQRTHSVISQLAPQRGFSVNLQQPARGYSGNQPFRPLQDLDFLESLQRLQEPLARVHQCLEHKALANQD